MRLAFDLDDTLIPCSAEFPVEPPLRSWLSGVLGHERLRRGTSQLLQYLRQQRCELWVYTTSFRRPLEVRTSFFLYGGWLRGVVNADRHRREIQKLGERFKTVVKYPPLYGVDLLIDDSEAIAQEGKQYDYRTELVRPDNLDWVEQVIAAVETLRAERQR